MYFATADRVTRASPPLQTDAGKKNEYRQGVNGKCRTEAREPTGRIPARRIFPVTELTGLGNNVNILVSMKKSARRGQRQKPQSERMSRVIGLRVTEAEYLRLQELAKNEHLPLAAWVRGRLLRCLEEDAGQEARQKEQQESLEEAKFLLRETRALYQTALPLKGKRRK